MASGRNRLEVEHPTTYEVGRLGASLYNSEIRLSKSGEHSDFYQHYHAIMCHVRLRWYGFAGRFMLVGRPIFVFFFPR